MLIIRELTGEMKQKMRNNSSGSKRERIKSNNASQQNTNHFNLYPLDLFPPNPTSPHLHSQNPSPHPSSKPSHQTSRNHKLSLHRAKMMMIDPHEYPFSVKSGRTMKEHSMKQPKYFRIRFSSAIKSITNTIKSEQVGEVNGMGKQCEVERLKRQKRQRRCVESCRSKETEDSQKIMGWETIDYYMEQ